MADPTYDISNEQGKVRLLISDVGGADGKSFLYTDLEIQAFIDLNTGVYSAAASALRAIAGNEAQVQKRITFLELKTDGVAVGKELRELATDFEAREDTHADGDFEVADISGYPGTTGELEEEEE